MEFEKWYKKDNEYPDITVERVLIANDTANARNLFYQYAHSNGGIIGVECKTLTEIAKCIVAESLARNAEVTDKRMVLDPIDTAVSSNIIMSIANEHIGKFQYRYFIREVITKNTCDEFCRIINMIRANKAKRILAESDEPRIQDILFMVERYEDYLQENKLYDKIRLISESIQYLKKHDCIAKYAEYARLDDFIPTKIELELLALLNTEQEPITIQEEKPATYHFVKCYGMSDEIRYIARQIKGIYPGDIAVYYTNDKYINFIDGVFQAQNIPIVFSNGTPVENNEDFVFFINILEWAENGFNMNMLEKVIGNRTIEFKDKSGQVFSGTTFIKDLRRIGYLWGIEPYIIFSDTDINAKNTEREETEKAFIGELVKIFITDTTAYGVFERIYCLWQKYRKKKSVYNKEYGTVIHKLESVKISLESDKKVSYSLKETVVKLKQILKENTLGGTRSISSVQAEPIGDMRKVMCRKYNFIVGMSSDLMLRKNDESPLMYDGEIRRCFSESDRGISEQYLGEYRNKVIRENFEYTLRTLSGEGSITMSYPYYNQSELRERSPSETFLNYSNRFGIKPIQYNTLDNNSSNQANFLYTESKTTDECEDDETVDNILEYIAQAERGEEVQSEEKEEDNVYQLSATSFHTLLVCPRLYALKYIYHIDETTEEEVNLRYWLKPNQKGSLFHRIMELYVKYAVEREIYFDRFDEEIFESVYEESKKEYDILPYASTAVKNNELKNIRESAFKYITYMIEEYHNGNDRYLPNAAEKEWQTCDKDEIQLDDGIKLIAEYAEGYIDRLDSYTENGRTHYRLVDYKTGSFSKFISEYENILVQHYVYCHSLKNDFEEQGLIYGKDFVIDCFEFVFPMSNDNVVFQYENGIFKETEKTDKITKIVIGSEEIFRVSDKIKILLSAFVKSGKSDFESYPEVRGKIQMSEVGNQFCEFKSICGICP